MSNTQGRIKQRRQYLKKKVWAYSLMASGSVIFGIAVFVASICYLGADIDRTDVQLELASATQVFGLVAWLGWKTLKHGKQALPLTYVAPVTADTLPAEEVLVRGSEEPAQKQSKVLLRGTDSSRGTGEQELLRSSQGQEQD